MKVFYCPMSGDYSGGGIMVAAVYINTQRIVPVACLYNFEGNLIDAAVEAIKAVKKLMS